MDDKIKLQVPAVIEKVTTLVDGGSKMVVVLPELNPEEMTILFALKGKSGYLGFAESQLKPEDLDVPEPGREFSTDKSPSQRLRAVIHVFWEQNTDKKKSFDDFYRDYIGKLVEQIKEKLN
jgi:hypothetical protein